MLTRRRLPVAATLLATPVLAQPAWPGRQPIRLIPTAPPGGLVDTVARLIAPPMAAQLGQNVIVENRPGAGGVIGTDFVAKAPADGYTFLMTHAGVMVYSAATLPSLPFDPLRDFTHLGMLVEAASVLLVRGDSPFRTLLDYMDAARSRPIRYGSSGTGSALHILGAMLGGAANLPELDHAPYQGSAPAIRDLLGGHIESVFDPITTNVEALRSGQLRALAVSSPARLVAFPAIPTFAELGLPGLVQTIWLGLSGPRGLPAPIAERMQAIIPALVRTPAVLERMTELVTLPRDPTPLGADFVALMQREMATAREVAQRYNITANS